MQVGIWEERKVFGSRAQVLKEELVGKQLENSNRNGKSLNFKLVIQIFFADYMFAWILDYSIWLWTNPISLFHSYKQRPSAGNKLEKIVSEYHIVYGGQSDEDVILSKCRNAISSLEKAEKEISSDINSGIPARISS